MSRYKSFEHLRIAIDERIATVTINRPEALNAINVDVHKELERIWAVIDADPDVDAVIVTGAGRAFSSGGDIKKMRDRAGTEEGLHHALSIPAGNRRIMHGILDLQQPVIAAVNGDVTGLGATIALLCDAMIIAEDARIGDTHVVAGLVAGDGGAVVWPLMVGPQRAKEFLMTGKLITGAEAVASGLGNAAVPADQVIDEARAMAGRMLRHPKWAVRWTKLAINKQIRQQLNLVLDAGLGYELATLFTEDHKEAAQAFAEKRKPQFKGY
ncbi:enoyl-CoA hydratase/isomerase family protein [Novosphingopyxis sp.]|uniref:enoyl-CoA hydratase/isomerase family protein n=1 Tax=Novosphingopyxis sp. TaxID=2709690 RepID=UPI003B5BF434